MSKEMQDVIDMLADGVFDELKKCTKPKLIERFAVIALKTQVQQETINGLESDMLRAESMCNSNNALHKREFKKLEAKLAKSESDGLTRIFGITLLEGCLTTNTRRYWVCLIN